MFCLDFCSVYIYKYPQNITNGHENTFKILSNVNLKKNIFHIFLPTGPLCNNQGAQTPRILTDISHTDYYHQFFQCTTVQRRQRSVRNRSTHTCSILLHSADFSSMKDLSRSPIALTSPSPPSAPSCLHAAVQRRTDGTAADAPLLHLYLHLILIPRFIRPSSLRPAVLRPSTPVLAHYFAAPSPGSGARRAQEFCAVFFSSSSFALICRVEVFLREGAGRGLRKCTVRSQNFR